MAAVDKCGENIRNRGREGGGDNNETYRVLGQRCSTHLLIKTSRTNKNGAGRAELVCKKYWTIAELKNWRKTVKRFANMCKVLISTWQRYTLSPAALTEMFDFSLIASCRFQAKPDKPDLHLEPRLGRDSVQTVGRRVIIVRVVWRL